VGETLSQRQGGTFFETVRAQLEEVLHGLKLTHSQDLIIAYEPVWAIGTGKTASKEQAQEVHALIRKVVAEMFSQQVADAVRIQYGGSVKAENARELMAQSDVDGALVGGAALKADSFAGIIKYE